MLTHLLSIRMQFGRCSVRTFYPPALEVLRDHIDIFSSFVEHKVPIDKAEEVSPSHPLSRLTSMSISDTVQYYKLFEKNLISKTVFVMNQ